MIERKLKPPPGYVGFRRIMCQRDHISRPKPEKKKKTKFEAFADAVMAIKGRFTTCDLPIDKRRANFYLRRLIEEKKIRLLPERKRVEGVNKGVNLYEVLGEPERT